MHTEESSLAEALAALARWFPASQPLQLRPSAGAFPSDVAARYAGGHAARWFAACDGQAQDDEAFADGYVLCSLAEALAAAADADALRGAEPSSWVQPQWLLIASDAGGRDLMLDDRDGRLLAVSADDPQVRVLAPSAEFWLQQLAEQSERGERRHDPDLGLSAGSPNPAERTSSAPALGTPRPSQPGGGRVRALLSLAMAALIAGVALWWASRTG